MRRGVMTLFGRLGERLGHGLDELTLTTNGTQLAKYAQGLADCGVRRVNVSLDTLDAARFARITRWGKLERVLEGVAAAKAAGLHVKINAVALRGENEDELGDLLAWCGAEGHDLCLIETMPMGDIDGDRTSQYLPLSIVRAQLRQRFTLVETSLRDRRTRPVLRRGGNRGTGGVHHAHDPQLLRELQQGAADLHWGAVSVPGAGGCRRICARVLRAGATEAELDAAVLEAIGRKPKGHDFIIDRRTTAPSVARHMSLTGRLEPVAGRLMRRRTSRPVMPSAGRVF